MAFRPLYDRVGVISDCQRRNEINTLVPLEGQVFQQNRVESCLYFTRRADSIGHRLAQRMMIGENVTPAGARPLTVVP
ncbi:hypothetical protein FHS52_001356 [Erythromicrobium ramosum]|uniref:Uncharacterized protein n=1 Tax=Erythrobacter ramosus TaxID=35811 RepID=A0A6I4UKP4_9SPHN|nr:hypothetical protein [Erythrobacter ramosus]MBB3775387.1 hypothetical protein [Erythrobacter ramosus]MXP39500.1 hypothetical protein [Erythrobacter ramosus]